MEKKIDTEATKSKVTKYTEQDMSKEQPGFVVYHSFQADELATFLAFINDVLKDDPNVKEFLPLANEDALTNLCKDGIILCKLINQTIPSTVDDRVINRKKPLNIYHQTENIHLAINSCMSIGCHIVNITPQTILDGKLHLIMGIVWQILRIYLLKEINLKKVPEIIVLAEAGEKLEDILKLPSEKILVRWINYHMKMAKQSIVIKDIGPELKDCVAFIHLLNQLDPEKCDKSGLAETDIVKRTGIVVTNGQKLGVKPFIRASALSQGNPKLNLVFLSLLFNAKHGLQISQEKKKEVEKATLIDDAKEGTKEERTFQLWINSLGMEGVYVTNLYNEVKDGLLMIKVIDKIWPGIAEAKRFEKAPNGNKFKMIANGNYIIELCKKQKIITTGIGGSDIADAKPHLILGLTWQLMRANYLQIIGGKTEEELVTWANSMVKKPPGIKNFKDPSLKTGRFFIDLLAAIEPDVVDWSLVKDGTKDEEVELNAKYAISIARKLGGKIFLTWEDIKRVINYNNC